MPGPVKIKETAMASFTSRSVQERGCRPRNIIELVIIISEMAMAAALSEKTSNKKNSA